MQTKELKTYKATQKGRRLIVEKCEDGYGVEEETDLFADIEGGTPYERAKARLKKQSGKNHWTLPYAYAGRQSEVHIWLVEDKDSSYFGKYHVYCGAVSEIADTFEEAAEQAWRFTDGGAL